MLDVTRQPDNNILYVAYKGKITDDDYEKVLIPALEAALKDYDKIRLLVQMGEDFAGMEGEAAWDDTKVGLQHFTHFEKIAVVTDVNWVRGSIKVFGFLAPGEVRLFGNSELDQAKGWITQ